MTWLIGESRGPERKGDLVFFSLDGKSYAIGAVHAVLLGEDLAEAGKNLDCCDGSGTLDDGDGRRPCPMCNPLDGER